MNPIRIALTDKCNKSIMNEFAARQLDSSKVLFGRYIEFQKDFKTLLKNNYKRIQESCTTPCRTFETV